MGWWILDTKVHSPKLSFKKTLSFLFFHRAHLEAIKSFGMHGFEMELDDLLTEYHAKQDYGAMMACLLKPALYVLQSASTASSGTSNLDTKKTSPKNGGQTRDGKGKDTILRKTFYTYTTYIL